MTRLVFMGTPDFAVPILRSLIDRYEVVGVVTRPDRATGRGRKVVPSPVKEFALAHGLRILQPKSLRRPEVVAGLEELKPQLIIVAAYGQILPPQVLTLPPLGCINVHPSLLPKYRGPSPVAGAILAGETETGVTLFLMGEGMDTGPILAQRRIEIETEDSRGSLSDKLSRLGAELLLETLPRWIEGEIVPQPQDDSRATYTKLISKGEGLIDWSRPAVEVWRRCRAYHPWPSAYTYWQGRLFKVLRARALPGWSGGEEPGRVMRLPEGIGVSAGEGVLLLEEVQLAGKKAMSSEEFSRGQRGFLGSVLGKEGK